MVLHTDEQRLTRRRQSPYNPDGTGCWYILSEPTKTYSRWSDRPPFAGQVKSFLVALEPFVALVRGVWRVQRGSG
jgi:hypothetical protein